MSTCLQCILEAVFSWLVVALSGLCLMHPPSRTRCLPASGKLPGAEWCLTVIYGLSQEPDKPAFIPELHELRQIRLGPWLLADDSNLIYQEEDKSSDRLNRRLMGQFYYFLGDATL
jgi:hypothetical protein